MNEIIITLNTMRKKIEIFINAVIDQGIAREGSPDALQIYVRVVKFCGLMSNKECEPLLSSDVKTDAQMPKISLPYIDKIEKIFASKSDFENAIYARLNACAKVNTNQAYALMNIYKNIKATSDNASFLVGAIDHAVSTMFFAYAARTLLQTFTPTDDYVQAEQELKSFLKMADSQYEKIYNTITAI